MSVSWRDPSERRPVFLLRRKGAVMLRLARRPVIFRTGGGHALVRLALVQCEVAVSGTGTSWDLRGDTTPVAVTVLFAALRLMHFTDWQWPAVTAPLWGLMVLTAASAAIALAAARHLR